MGKNPFDLPDIQRPKATAANVQNHAASAPPLMRGNPRATANKTSEKNNAPSGTTHALNPVRKIPPQNAIAMTGEKLGRPDNSVAERTRYAAAARIRPPTSNWVDVVWDFMRSGLDE